ncbi:MAG: DNA helicase RecQ [Candidatus Gracilibacteria bacterium]|jgi:ATP-dependent DNA helicase RecQ
MQKLLKTHFGYDKFRPLQEEIIYHILQKQEALVIMATGGGKSLCYQLPALAFPGLTLVISPLIALMKDQVDSLNSNGIPAAFINSTLSFEAHQNIEFRLKKGQIKILYVTPERLALPAFQDFLHKLKLDLIAIDEAHCISEWGHDFRPEYRNLKSLRKNFPKVPLMALTATATDKVRLDIIEQLGLSKAKTFLSSFNRSNLTYQMRPKKKALEELVVLLKKYENESVIIYCFSRKRTEEIAERLQEENLRALPYHAGLDAEKRKDTQEKFIHDETSIIVATIAFGMGIDKPNVRLVVHFDLPKSVESYYQETGRAGRDGLPSECVLFYSYGDKIKHNFFINQIADPDQRKGAAEKLAQIIQYAELQTCRRAYLLKYFGENQIQENCQGCDNCLATKESFDATGISWKILSAILRTEERFGLTYIVDVLRGKETEKTRERQHQKLSVFGVAKDEKAEELRQIIELLIANKILQKTTGEYPVLKVTEEGRVCLNTREKIFLSRPTVARDSLHVATVNRARVKKNAATVVLDYHRPLFEQLRVLRKGIADKKRVPPFIIFGDVSLQEMSFYLPQSNDTFAFITGVGRMKLAEYGPDFLAIIKAYAETNNLEDRFLK